MTISGNNTKKKKRVTQSEYAEENKRRQAEWELSFRARIESLISQLGGPGKISEATHIKAQTLQKIRRGGSRLALFATLVDMTGVNANWLLLGSTGGEHRFRQPKLGLVGDAELEHIAVPGRRPGAKKVAAAEKPAVDGKKK